MPYLCRLPKQGKTQPTYFEGLILGLKKGWCDGRGEGYLKRGIERGVVRLEMHESAATWSLELLTELVLSVEILSLVYLSDRMLVNCKESIRERMRNNNDAID